MHVDRASSDLPHTIPDSTLPAMPCRRYYITRHSLPSLNDVGLLRFRGEPWLASCVLQKHHTCHSALQYPVLALHTLRESQACWTSL